MKCPICQQDNADENRFCFNCGARLASAPAGGELGPAKRRDSVIVPLEEERAREKKRVEVGKRTLLVRGIVVGALVAAAIGAFAGVMAGFAMGPRTPQTATMGVAAYAILSGLTSALQGAVAGAIVGAIVVTAGGGSETGWRAGVLVNAAAYTLVFALRAIGWGHWIVLVGPGTVLWAFVVGLLISSVWGAFYGWLIGAFVESSLDRW